MSLNHRAIGDIPAKEREGMNDGWREMLESIKKRVEK